jgi:nucleoid-associated protein YgaU
MKPLSYSQRLAVGFGTIALGVCVALPFRRTERMAEVIPDVAADSGLALSADVALQLPGTPAAAADAPSTSLPGKGTASGHQPAARDDAGDQLKLVPLPSLPDRFQPLEEKTPAATSPFGVIVEPPQLPQPVAKSRRHTIRDGDTLESLALRYLDDEGRASEIFAANRAILSDPTLLPIGAKLTIPSGNRPADSPASAELVPLPR